jgi:hypothetical protein
MDWRAYFQLAYKSYWWNLLVIGVPCALGLFSFNVSDWLQGKITTWWLLRTLLISGLTGMAGSAFVYYVLLRPYMRSLGFDSYEDMKREYDRQRHRK